MQTKDERALKDIQFTAKLIRRHTEGYQAKTGGKMPMGPMLRGILTSPDYSFKDIIALVKNGYSKNNSIWKELLQLDLRDTLLDIQIPYRILQGVTNIVTSTNTITAFATGCGNSSLRLQTIENNGPLWEFE